MRFRTITLAAAIVFLSGAAANAQYRAGRSYVGPVAGLDLLNTRLIIGVNYEYALQRDWGVGGLFRYWSQSAYKGSDYRHSVISVGGQGNYHFKVPNPELDPYVGAGVAINIVSETYQGPAKPDYLIFKPASDQQFDFWLHGGARYFLTPTVTLNGRIAFGTNATLEVGADFAI